MMIHRMHFIGRNFTVAVEGKLYNSLPLYLGSEMLENTFFSSVIFLSSICFAKVNEYMYCKTEVVNYIIVFQEKKESCLPCLGMQQAIVTDRYYEEFLLPPLGICDNLL